MSVAESGLETQGCVTLKVHLASGHLDGLSKGCAPHWRETGK